MYAVSVRLVPSLYDIIFLSPYLKVFAAGFASYSAASYITIFSVVTFNAIPAAWHSSCKNFTSDVCTCSFLLNVGLSLASYIRESPLSPAICSPIAFNVIFSHALDFFSIRIVEVYGIDVLFTVTFVGGPDTSIPSISKVPIFKVASFPVSFQFCWTRTAVTSFGFAPCFTSSTVSTAVLFAVPPVVILNTCPG